MATTTNSGDGVGTFTKVSAVAGAAALGLAARGALRRSRRSRPFDPRQMDLKKLAKQLGDLAERVEHASEGVRNASARAKEMSKSVS